MFAQSPTRLFCVEYLPKEFIWRETLYKNITDFDVKKGLVFALQVQLFNFEFTLYEANLSNSHYLEVKYRILLPRALNNPCNNIRLHFGLDEKLYFIHQVNNRIVKMVFDEKLRRLSSDEIFDFSLHEQVSLEVIQFISRGRRREVIVDSTGNMYPINNLLF